MFPQPLENSQTILKLKTTDVDLIKMCLKVKDSLSKKEEQQKNSINCNQDITVRKKRGRSIKVCGLKEHNSNV